jgi:signal transduction histidine kinase
MLGEGGFASEPAVADRRPPVHLAIGEMQQFAHESQPEVREVVRGYREADLNAELAGAHGVLTAAGGPRGRGTLGLTVEVPLPSAPSSSSPCRTVSEVTA